jgi:hypothetical protein
MREILYKKVTQELAQRDILFYFQNEDQLVVTKAIPNVPSVNSFWITNRDGKWYLATWASRMYAISAEDSVAQVCEAVLKSSERARPAIDKQLLQSLDLRELTGTEMERILQS